MRRTRTRQVRARAQWLFPALALAGLAWLASGAWSSITLAQTPDDGLVAPKTTIAANGLAATDGVRTLSVSKAAGVDPAGEVLVVNGAGYNVERGIYVAFCVIPALNQVPTPCGGGIDLSGQAGASAWVSSNPPSYGVGLATPYGAGGSFSLRMAVAPVINDTNDCRIVRCAIVSRGDHTRTSDRSQDIFVPITFAAPGQAAPVATATPVAAAAVAPTATPVPPTATPVPPTATPVPPPRTTLSSDGKTATSGARSLAVSTVTLLDPAGAKVTVAGRGYDETTGVYVALCAVSMAGAAPGPCSTGGADVSVWLSSDPPEYGRALAVAYKPGGAFEVPLTLRPAIDTTTDCREVACAVVTRKDDLARDKSPDYIAVPVRFAATSAIDEQANAPASPASAASESSGSNTGVLLAVAAVVLVVLAGAAYMLRGRLRSGGAS